MKRIALWRRRLIPWPTVTGWALLAVLAALPFLGWFFFAERFLAARCPHPEAQLLVVEGWMGRAGVREAGREFSGAGYDAMVATGGLNEQLWGDEPLDTARLAAAELRGMGMAEERVWVAQPRETDTGRTYESALAVKRVLQDRAAQVGAVDVFTLGAHARRSRLVYAKVLGPSIEVGCIPWMPTKEAEKGRRWWRSSNRAKHLITETVGYLFERLLNSGRSPSRKP